MTAIAFFVGMTVGSIAGAFGVSLAVAARRADDQIEAALSDYEARPKRTVQQMDEAALAEARSWTPRAS